MLDIQFIIQNQEYLKTVMQHKNFKVDLDLLLEIYKNKKNLEAEINKLRFERNQLAELFKTKGKDLSAEEKNLNIEKGKSLRKKIELKEKEFDSLNHQYKNLMLKVPNIFLKDTPIGKTSLENQPIRFYREKNSTPKAKTYLELAEYHDLIDFKRGVDISGTKNYFLKNEAVLLEIALMRFAYDLLLKRGFRPFSVPLLVKKEALYGTGYFPGGEEEIYSIEKDQQYLIGTSEVALCSYYKDEIFNIKDLPIKAMAWSTCFRREAGTYGKQSQGLYRIHQFQKIEQVAIVPNDAEQSDIMHKELLKNAEDILQALDLPYRVVRVCSGDLGLGQVMKHDIEAWMPSRNEYGETHSCSSFYDFQSRRLNICFKDGASKNYVYTLNNTAIASPRILIPLLEFYQNDDLSIDIPKVLIPYMSGISRINNKKKKFF